MIENTILPHCASTYKELHRIYLCCLGLMLLLLSFLMHALTQQRNAKQDILLQLLTSSQVEINIIPASDR